MTTTTRHLATRIASLGLGLLFAVSACKTGNGETNNPDGASNANEVEPTPAKTIAKPGRVWPPPPPPTAPKPVKFPKIADFRLDNDLAVYVIENHEVPIVSAQLVVRCGYMDHEYLSGFTASMLGEGTRSRSKAKLDEAIEFVGGTLIAGSGMHVSTVFSRSLRDDLKLSLLLMADEVQNATFPAGALTKLKAQAKASLRMATSQPDVLADTLFGMAVYPAGHPYGRPLATNSAIDSIGIEDVRRFHKTFYRSNNAFLLLSGDITAAEAKPLVQRAFGEWTAAELKDLPANPLNGFTRYELPQKLNVHLVNRPGSAQASIRVGNLAMARNHEDWAALEVANGILGAGPNSRLFADLREEQGLTYGISSAVEPGQAPGTFSISTQTRTPTTGAIIAGIFEHIAQMRNEDPPRAEFETVVRQNVGSFPLQVETPQQIVGKVRTQIIYGLPANYWQSYRDNITRVELKDVRQAALRYIHALPVVVVVGDADEIRPQIKRVLPTANVIEYDNQLRKQ
ncbi:MAG: insulinase family protein [Deltaproteobacteria bacterium]|nr:insulinase family protein [Deltaproteobacteria bacterium]